MAQTLDGRYRTPAAQIRLAQAGVGILGALAPELATRIVLRLFCSPRRTHAPASSYAAQVRQTGTPFSLLHGTATLAGIAWGDGPAVLLVHGWESDSDSMLHFVGPLTARGLRAVAFDGPAHGRSSGRQTDLVDFGRALGAVARHAGPLHAVVGHSFGAAATLLVLAGSPSLAPRAVASLGAPIDLEYMLTVFGATLGLRPALLARLRESIRAQYGPLEQFSLPAVAGRITTPGLVVHDRSDRRVPYAHAEALTRAWPASSLMTTEGLGHRGTLRDERVIERVAEFVAHAAQAG